MASTIEEIGSRDFWARVTDKAARARVPLQASIELTWGCNLRCVHCYNPTHIAKNELTTARIYRIIDQLAGEGCLHLSFTGGELFTRGDYFEILAYAKSRGFTSSLLTNATLVTPAVADRVQALRPQLVEVSIYGATARTYERVTRIPGSYRHFVEGIRLLRDRQVPLLVKMAVMTLNQHEVRRARALVESWGLRFTHSADIHPRVDGSTAPLEYRLAPADVVGVTEALWGFGESGEGSQDGAHGCGGQVDLFGCKCGRSTLAVTPHGRMNLCVALPIPQYDLSAGTVARGWRRLVALVDRANASAANDNDRHECPSCDLRDACQQGPMDAYLATGELEPCVPYYKELANAEKVAAGRPLSAGKR